MKTREETAEARKNRHEERRLIMERLPRVDLASGDGVLLILDDGESRWLEVRAQWNGKDWSGRTVSITNLSALAAFINGLCKRMNVQLEMANAEISQINAIVGEKITREIVARGADVSTRLVEADKTTA